ncbi:hypothetical protein, partial [Caldovatus aquaticus]|nr:hypothetical protein [Caldovatus aquaticus]
MAAQDRGSSPTEGAPGAAGPPCDAAAAGCDAVEVSLDLARLISAFGPDLLLQVPRRIRGARNTLTGRALISLHAARAPGFLAELPTADLLRHIAFRVEGAREQAFLDAVRGIVRAVLLEPQGGAATPPRRGRSRRRPEPARRTPAPESPRPARPGGEGARASRGRPEAAGTGSARPPPARASSAGAAAPRAARSASGSRTAGNRREREFGRQAPRRSRRRKRRRCSGS